MTTEPPGSEPTDRIEIPLTGTGGEPGSPGEPSPSEPTDWRRLVAIASLAGTALGVVVSVVILTSDGDDRPPPSTTVAPDAIAELITTPPTLPRPGVADLAEMDGTTSQDRSLFDPDPSIAAPQYPSLGLPDEALDRFDLAGATARLDIDVARRSTTRYEIGRGGFVIDVAIGRDPANDRYELVIDGDADRIRVVVDVATGTGYVQRSAEPDAWRAVALDVLSPREDFAALLGRLLLGPVRTDTLSGATLVAPGDAVAIADGAAPARRFSVLLTAGQVPEWARYRLGPVGDAPPPLDDDPILFFTYVSEADQIVEVSGTFPFGNTEQLVVHRIETLPPSFEVEVPDVPPTTAPQGDAPSRVGPDDRANAGSG